MLNVHQMMSCFFLWYFFCNCIFLVYNLTTSPSQMRTQLHSQHLELSTCHGNSSLDPRWDWISVLCGDVTDSVQLDQEDSLSPAKQNGINNSTEQQSFSLCVISFNLFLQSFHWSLSLQSSTRTGMFSQYRHAHNKNFIYAFLFAIFAFLSVFFSQRFSQSY